MRLREDPECAESEKRLPWIPEIAGADFVMRFAVQAAFAARVAHLAVFARATFRALA